MLTHTNPEEDEVAWYLMWWYTSISIIQFMYSGITCGRVLDGELLYTKILEVNSRSLEF